MIVMFVAGRRVGREHDARLVRVDHLLHDHGDVNLLVGEVLLNPIINSPGAVERCPASLDRLDKVVRSPDVQVCLLLAGEARLRQVFGRRAGPGGHVDLAAFTLT